MDKFEIVGAITCSNKKEHFQSNFRSIPMFFLEVKLEKLKTKKYIGLIPNRET